MLALEALYDTTFVYDGQIRDTESSCSGFEAVRKEAVVVEANALEAALKWAMRRGDRIYWGLRGREVILRIEGRRYVRVLRCCEGALTLTRFVLWRVDANNPVTDPEEVVGLVELSVLA